MDEAIYKVPEERKAIMYAKYIVTYCQKINKPITNLRLQDALYELQKVWILKTDKTLFDDVIEAWKWGPCIPEVYYYFCNHGSMPIFGSLEKYGEPFCIKNDSVLRDIINRIAEKFSTINPWDLVKSTAYKKVMDLKGIYGQIRPELIKLEAEGKQ